jgi:ATP-dependent protease HslVU (ClpYQ) ATPase subunit
VDKFQEPQPGQYQNMKRNEIEQMAERFDKLKWEVYNIPLLVVSEESDITPIYKSIEQIPKPLREFKMRIEKEDYKEYDKMTHEEIVEKILNICVSDKNRKAVREQTNLYNLVFTLDNFLKLVLIYLRVRSNIPIILMGETGVGKTSLVDFLSKIIDAEFMIKNIHAGITEEEIIDFVN